MKIKLNKIITRAVVLALTTSLLTGFAVQGNAAESNGELNVSFPAGNIRVAINIIALQKGYFDEEGVKINPVAIGGNDALTAINEENGNLDILNTGFIPDVQAIGSGYDLVFIGGTAVEGGAIIAKKGNAAKYQDDSSILNFDEVTAATLGFKRNESSWAVTRQYLIDNGVAAETIQSMEAEDTGSISYYGEETEVALAVQKGQIELGFIPLEFALLYQDAYDLELVTEAGKLIPDYVCCREVTSKKRLDEKFDSFVAYERARIRAYEYYKSGETDAAIKDEIVELVTDYSGKEKDYVETYLYGGVTKYAVDPNTKAIEKYIEVANNSGLFAGSKVDFASYDITQNIDASVFQQAIEGLADENPDNQFYKQLLEEHKGEN